jgi:hypothetical protein
MSAEVVHAFGPVNVLVDNAAVLSFQPVENVENITEEDVPSTPAPDLPRGADTTPDVMKERSAALA